MTEETSSVDVLAVIARHRDSHMCMMMSDAYSAQEYPRLTDTHDAICALLAMAANVVAADDRQALCQEDIDLLRGAIMACKGGAA